LHHLQSTAFTLQLIGVELHIRTLDRILVIQYNKTACVSFAAVQDESGAIDVVGYTWAQLLLFFFFYCFLGWVFESCYVSIHARKFSNRGFLRGPVIPIYGFGAMMIVFATTPFRGNYLAEFIAGMLAATLFEYVVGISMEAIFKVKYWDYSHKPFQFHGYICLESSLCWGVLSVLAAELLQTHIEAAVFSLSEQLAIFLAMGGTILFCIDTLVSARDAWGVRNMVIALEKLKAEVEALQQELEARSEEFVQQMEQRLQEKKAELTQLRVEQQEELVREIDQLRRVIETERQERELARARFAARVERDITALQLRIEQERSAFYEKLQQYKDDYEAGKLRQSIRENLLLQALTDRELQLEALFEKPGNILKRNPNAVTSKLGNLRQHLERQRKRRKAAVVLQKKE